VVFEPFFLESWFLSAIGPVQVSVTVSRVFDLETVVAGWCSVTCVGLLFKTSFFSQY